MVGFFCLFQEKTTHRLKGTFIESDGAMLAFGYRNKLGQQSFFPQCFGEKLALTMWYHIVCLAMDYQKTRIRFIQKGDGTGQRNQVEVVSWVASDKSRFRRVPPLGPLQSSINAKSIGPNQSTTALTALLVEV